MPDQEEIIHRAQEVIDDLALDEPDRVELLNLLGVYLDHGDLRAMEVTELEEILRLTRSTEYHDSVRMAREIINTVHRAQQANDALRMAREANDSIRMARETIDAFALDDPNQVGLLDLVDREEIIRVAREVNDSVRMAWEAIDAFALDDPDRVGFLNPLGFHLGDRDSWAAEMADPEELIHMVREAIDDPALDGPGGVGLLDDLGTYLGDRYKRTGEIVDLEAAIKVEQEVIDATPSNRPDRAGRLNNLGGYLSDRYSHTGAMTDLEEAIRLIREAIDATPLDHPNRAGHLNNLGVYLGYRFSRTGAMTDLEKAIQVEREAIDATPSDHSGRARTLNNFGCHLGYRYTRTGEMTDLEEAIRVTQEAIDTTPLQHPDRAGFLNSLGNHLGYRYTRTGEMTDLEEAIRVTQEAIDATPLQHPYRAGYLNNLGNRLGERYSSTGEMTDLEEAIRVTQEAIDATPLQHPDRAGYLNNLGNRLGDRFSQTGDMADLVEAKEHYVTALHHSAAAVSMRVAAGRRFLSSPYILQDQQAYAIAKTAIDLIPLLTPRSLQNSDKTHLLSAAVGLSSDAAAIALHDNRGPVAAIELLETGRGVIAGTVFEQSDVAALERAHPDLARSFIDLRERLDAPPPMDSLGTAERPTAAVEAEGDRRRDAGPQLAALLEAIRSKSGFERFLLAASEADMRETARPGPIVVLNVSSYRCDALLIEQSGIRLLELPRLSRSALIDLIQELESLETLGWLWDAIVCPVLNALGFTGTPADSSQWPHVWWVPTGILTRFPLHAAGHHLKRTGETAVDRVVSSYASSVKAIIHSRRRPQQAPPAAGESRNAVVVAMQNTPKQEPLKHANDEVDAVVAVCESMGLPHDRPRPHKADVLSALSACGTFHFAGHGSTHPTEPLQSQLLLDDWEREPFTVASLLETSLTLQRPFLAYLSACGTGQILDEGSVDESIHLANACQLTGFRHVVGTLWSVDDGLCVDMARTTYEFLRDEGIRDECVSLGLHRAMRTIRDRWVDDEDGGRGKVLLPGARDGELKHGSEARRPLWVPYVHFGV